MPRLRASDYFQQLIGLWPQGWAWNSVYKADSKQAETLKAISEEPARIDGRAWDLIEEVDPRTTIELLEDWERVLGLPDACTGQLETLQQRRNAIVAKLTQIGKQTPQYFIDVAERLGFEITITEYRPFRAGQSYAGEMVMDESAIHYWQVNAPATSSTLFYAGQSLAGEHLWTFNNDQLECALNKIKPAHTILEFSYS
jgi:uncharacterized protein YmfQ (DUF2313 family)